MTATLIDVAERAGVSKSTVSNVIRGVVPVAPDTQLRVQAAIVELGYQPNVIARSLQQRASRTLGLIVPDPVNPFYSVLALGAERVAYQCGYALLVSNTECSPATEAESIRALIGRRVDGVLVAGQHERSRLHTTLLDRGIPVVLASFEADDPRLGMVVADERGAMEQVVDHLAQLGHRRVAFRRHALHEATGEQRRIGFEQVARRRGMQVVSSDQHSTAIAAHNDMIAIGCIDELERAGHRVPDDVSVVGFDDIPLAAHHRIELTTVRCDGEALGRQATAMLIGAIEAGQPPAARVVTEATLVVRHSTGPVRTMP